MAASGTMQELTALEQARARLEAALAGDESWRALQQSAGRDDAQESAARRARNTRLKMALAENPLYQAWKHLGEAILALRESAARGEPAAGGLPDEVAALLRSETEAVSQGAFGSLAGRLRVSLPGDGPRAAPAAPLPRTPVNRGAPARPGDESHLNARGRPGAEPDEATVTFVRRGPLLPSAELPADLGSERPSELFERLRALSDEPEPSEAAFSTGKGTGKSGAEEAEVVIVSGESAQTRREAEGRAGTIRRLRRALSGD